MQQMGSRFTEEEEKIGDTKLTNKTKIPGG
jgi:hypothetical protein